MPKKQKRAAIEADKMIGQRVRQLRMQMEMSQEALGDEVGVSFQQIQKYEKGVNRISVTRMLEFCSILQTTPNDIIGWKMPATPVVNAFNSTVYSAARDFSEMPEGLQIAVRRICDAIVDVTKKKR
jgi:transcriptional regulator with XRE-family HTH domain